MLLGLSARVLKGSPACGPAPVPTRASAAVLRCLSLGSEYSSETLPEKLTPAWGKKVAAKVAVCSGARVRGVPRPLTLNAVPNTFAWKIVRLSLPAFVRTTECDTLVPT